MDPPPFAGFFLERSKRMVSNAFACTLPAKRFETIDALILEEDRLLFDQRACRSVVQFECLDGPPFWMVPQAGNFIGSAEGPLFFMAAFQRAVQEWLDATGLFLPDRFGGRLRPFGCFT